MEQALGEIQKGFDGVYQNFDIPFVGKLFQGPVAWWSRFNTISTGPSDASGREVAHLLRQPSAQRERIFGGVYVPSDPEQALGRLENAFRLCAAADSVVRRLRKAAKEGRLEKGAPLDQLDAAVATGVLTEVEAEEVRCAEVARRDAIDVDSFSREDYLATAEGGGWS
tara:strand:- start:140 stop:643 length:504 start_codon:yes stop_codon:yes gene_type:complete